MSVTCLIQAAVVVNCIMAQVGVDPMPAGFTAVDTTGVTPAPGPGWGYANGAFTPPASPALSPAQAGAAAYQTALAAGVPVSCAPGATLCTSAVAATYPLAGPVYDDLKDAVVWTKAYGAFPNGASSLAFVLSPTVAVTFSSPAQMGAVGQALASYVVALKQAYVATQAGGPWSPPAMPAPLP